MCYDILDVSWNLVSHSRYNGPPKALLQDWVYSLFILHLLGSMPIPDICSPIFFKLDYIVKSPSPTYYQQAPWGVLQRLWFQDDFGISHFKFTMEKKCRKRTDENNNLQGILPDVLIVSQGYPKLPLYKNLRRSPRPSPRHQPPRSQGVRQWIFLTNLGMVIDLPGLVI